MATPVLIPVEEYLRAVYRPECDYIDGEVQERPVGEKLHARVIDPWRGTAFSAGPDAVLHEQKAILSVPGTSIQTTVPEIFAGLDRLEKRAAPR